MSADPWFQLFLQYQTSQERAGIFESHTTLPEIYSHSDEHHKCAELCSTVQWQVNKISMMLLIRYMFCCSMFSNWLTGRIWGAFLMKIIGFFYFFTSNWKSIDLLLILFCGWYLINYARNPQTKGNHRHQTKQQCSSHPWNTWRK